MTIKEAEEFYQTDNEEYILEKRKGFVNWFNKVYDDRNSYLSIDGLQDLVDKIIMWYEFRYPDRLFDKGSIIDTRFLFTPDISNKMDMRQLLYRLSHEEYEVLGCNYRTGSAYFRDDKVNFGLNINKDKNSISDFFIYENGKLNYSTSMEFGNTIKTIEDFYERFKDLDVYDLTEVKACIERHNNDIILRNHVVDAVAKGLLYSRRTIPEKGKARMVKFKQGFISVYKQIDFENKVFDAGAYVLIEENVKINRPSFIKRMVERVIK